MSVDTDILIVGAGHAGAQAAAALRQRKFTGTITLLGDEPELPYERPPLSKEYLSGDKPFERILLRPATFWEKKDIQLALGKTVTGIDAQAHRADLSDGSALTYGRMIWATGGAPRRLTCPGADASGVHVVRSRADVDGLLADLPPVRRVAVVGGGYIGLEAAAVLRKLGREVVLIEAMDRLLARVAGPDVSAFYYDEHSRQGVDVRLGTGVSALQKDAAGRVRAVTLADGEEIACDAAIVGIGIIPAIEPLRAAGAACSNGVDVDELCATSLPDIYAIGDCAAHVNGYAGGAVVRLESVQNANDQANVVAKAMTGDARAYDAVPWFWSNQYDLKLQTVGLSAGYDDAILRGTPDDRSFSVVYLKAGKVIALDCINAMRDYAQGRALVIAGAAPDAGKLADGDVPLKELV